MLFPFDNFDRTLGNTLGKRVVTADVQLEDMDVEGIDLAVLYPTLGLFMSQVREADLAVALSRAYDDWIADYCRASPARLRGVALLQTLDPEAAAVELERAVSRLGLVAGMVPASSRGGARTPGDRTLDPIYAEAERLGVPIAIHADGSLTAANERFSTFIQVHVFSHVPEQMAALTATVLGGVFERFARLKLGFMEAGCGWVPFWLDHMDEEFELRHSEVPFLTAKPSEYVTSGRAYFGVEPEERLIPTVCQVLGEGALLYASDYPHWDSSWPESSRSLLDRTDITESQKQRILGANALAFYNLNLS
jgi:hypothetical protein